jgi:hypothetical protein
MRQAIAALKQERFICTPRVSKYRVFVWLPNKTLPDCATIAIAHDDDYTFGVLHSRAHELWARGQGTQLREVESGFRYTPTTTFETFPFPRPTAAQKKAIAQVAKHLNELREKWLNPEIDVLSNIDTKQRTLTNLYNERPSWLDLIHKELDAAVFRAYGWKDTDAPEQEILGRLLTLNLEREAAYKSGLCESASVALQRSQ